MSYQSELNITGNSNSPTNSLTFTNNQSPEQQKLVLLFVPKLQLQRDHTSVRQKKRGKQVQSGKRQYRMKFNFMSNTHILERFTVTKLSPCRTFENVWPCVCTIDDSTIIF
jgi:hypothetical protein